MTEEKLLAIVMDKEWGRVIALQILDGISKLANKQHYMLPIRKAEWINPDQLESLGIEAYEFNTDRTVANGYPKDTTLPVWKK